MLAKLWESGDGCWTEYGLFTRGVIVDIAG